LWETGVYSGVFTASETTWTYLWPESGNTLRIQYPAEGTPIATANANVDQIALAVDNDITSGSVRVNLSAPFYNLDGTFYMTVYDQSICDAQLIADGIRLYSESSSDNIDPIAVGKFIWDLFHRDDCKFVGPTTPVSDVTTTPGDRIVMTYGDITVIWSFAQLLYSI